MNGYTLSKRWAFLGPKFFEDGSFRCVYRNPRTTGGLGFINCHCAQFSDGSCVPHSIYPEFACRRDAELPLQGFRDRAEYPAMISLREKLEASHDACQ